MIHFNKIMVQNCYNCWSVESVSRVGRSVSVGRSSPYFFVFDLFACSNKRFYHNSFITAKQQTMEETLLSNEDEMWITVTDDMIMRAGYHACTSNATSNRSNFFRHVKTHYTNNKNYKITKQKITGKKGKGGHNKQTLQMTHAAYNDFLQSTYVLRKQSQSH